MIVGDCLLLRATIQEPNPSPHRINFYEGSSLELFIGSEEQGVHKEKPSQFFMLPPGNGETARFVGMMEFGSPESVAYRAWLTPSGWGLQLCAPLAVLGVSWPAGIFRFDLLLNVRSSVGGQNLLHLPVWGMRSNFTDASLLAVFEVVPLSH